MTCKWLVPGLFLLSSCAHLGLAPSESRDRTRLWDEAHGYFATSDFGRADSVFALIAERYPESNEGRESLFYRGALALDPRNPDFDSEPAEAHLQRYLLSDTAGGPRIHRRPEGETLYELAHQLNLPPGERIEDLAPPTERTTVVVRESAPQTLGQDNERLRREVAAREVQIQQLREELERIRKTLTGGQGP